MSVPEATGYEDNCVPFVENQIGPSWQILPVETKPKSQPVQNAADR